MIRYCFLYIFFAWILFTNVTCILRIPTEQNIQTDLIDIHIKEGRRTKRSIDDSFHPESYDIDLPLQGSTIQLHLIRNDQIGTAVPTLCLRQGSLARQAIKDEFESVFYQDAKQGATFVVQHNGFQASNMFGTFNLDGEEFIIQNIRNQSYTHIKHGSNKFEISRHKLPVVQFGDVFNTSKKIQNKFTKHKSRRHKRATGEHKLELLIVADYAVYKYWYDKSTKTTTTEKESDALTSVRQFYAFIITGMDGMYKNIQTTSYTISIVFAGIVIAQTPSDSTWTENFKVTSASPNQVDSNTALGAFRTWNRASSNLPGHDHAMLFTRYDLTAGGSTGNAGLAYVGAVCTDSSQSIVEDGFDFIMITVASHELGHCLSAQHDGEGNTCSFSDKYIMAASTSPQRDVTTATHPWIFSTCSTNYYTNYINSLDSSSNNCMKTLSSGFNPNGLSPYDQQLAGQVYNADSQCAQMRGTGSYFCNDRYNGDFSTLCTVMWCSDVTGNGFCHTHIAGDGTLCGNKKWCKGGVCTADLNAPSGNDNCLYGDKKGAIYSDGRTCADLVAENAAFYCPFVSMSCCYSCGTPTTTSVTSTTSATTTSRVTTSATTTPSVATSVTTSTAPLSTTPLNSLHPDNQCESKRGSGSHMCRFFYNGDYTSICTTLYCSSPGSSTCYFDIAAEGTMCGNKKWCVSGVCTSDINAPSGDDSCLYGDRIGAIFSNGWDCATMVRIAPNNCAAVPTQCCASCAPPTTPSTTTQSPTTQSPTTESQTTTTEMLTTTVGNPTTESQTTTTEMLTTTVGNPTTESQTTTTEMLTTTVRSATTESQTTTTEMLTTTVGNPTTESQTTTTEMLTTTVGNPTTESQTTTTEMLTTTVGSPTTESQTTTTEKLTTTVRIPTTESQTTTDVISTKNPTTTEPLSTEHITTTETLSTENPTTTETLSTENPTTNAIVSTEYQTTTAAITTTSETQTTITETISTTSQNPTTSEVISTAFVNPTTTQVAFDTSPAKSTTAEAVTTAYVKQQTTSGVITTTVPDNDRTSTESITATSENLDTTSDVLTTAFDNPITAHLTTMADRPTTAITTTADTSTTTVEQPTKTTDSVTTTDSIQTADQTIQSTSSMLSTVINQNTSTTTQDSSTTIESQTTRNNEPITSERSTTADQYQTTYSQGLSTATDLGESTSNYYPSTTSSLRPSNTTTQATTSTVHNPTTSTMALTSTYANPSATTQSSTSTLRNSSTTTQATTSTVNNPTLSTTALTSTSENPSTAEQTRTTSNNVQSSTTGLLSTAYEITTQDRTTTIINAAVTTTHQDINTSTEAITSTYDPTTSELTTTTTPITTTYKPARRECKLRCRLRLRYTVTFDLTNKNTNNYRTLFSQIIIALTNYYRRSRSCGSRFRRVILYSIRVGSLIADHDVVADEESEGNILSAVNDLVNGYGNLTFGNDSNAQTVEALSASVTNNNITSSVNPGDNLCQIFNQIESCNSGYGCAIDSNNSPYCAPVESEDDMYALLFGISVGIPAFFILLGFTLIICVYCKRRKQRKPLVESSQNDRSVPPEQQIFATQWPHRYSSVGRKSTNPLGGYWDNGAFESQESYDNGLYQRSIFAFPSLGTRSKGKPVQNGKSSHI